MVPFPGPVYEVTDSVAAGAQPGQVLYESMPSSAFGASRAGEVLYDNNGTPLLQGQVPDPRALYGNSAMGANKGNARDAGTGDLSAALAKAAAEYETLDTLNAAAEYETLDTLNAAQDNGAVPVYDTTSSIVASAPLYDVTENSRDAGASKAITKSGASQAQVVMRDGNSFTDVYSDPNENPTGSQVPALNVLQTPQYETPPFNFASSSAGHAGDAGTGDLSAALAKAAAEYESHDTLNAAAEYETLDALNTAQNAGDSDGDFSYEI